MQIYDQLNPNDSGEEVSSVVFAIFSNGGHLVFLT